MIYNSKIAEQIVGQNFIKEVSIIHRNQINTKILKRIINSKICSGYKKMVRIISLF